MWVVSRKTVHIARQRSTPIVSINATRASRHFGLASSTSLRPLLVAETIRIRLSTPERLWRPRRFVLQIVISKASFQRACARVRRICETLVETPEPSGLGRAQQGICQPDDDAPVRAPHLRMGTFSPSRTAPERPVN